jgi:hypothetical protein
LSEVVVTHYESLMSKHPKLRVARSHINGDSSRNAGKALFATTERRRGLELRKVQQLQDGRVSLIYAIG